MLTWLGEGVWHLVIAIKDIQEEEIDWRSSATYNRLCPLLRERQPIPLMYLQAWPIHRATSSG